MDTGENGFCPNGEAASTTCMSEGDCPVSTYCYNMTNDPGMMLNMSMPGMTPDTNMQPGVCCYYSDHGKKIIVSFFSLNPSS